MTAISRVFGGFPTDSTQTSHIQEPDPTNEPVGCRLSRADTLGNGIRGAMVLDIVNHAFESLSPTRTDRALR